jgi:ribosomal protein L11 methyltransferase
MGQLQLSFALGALDPERAESVCFELGALAVSFTDQRDDPILEPAPGEFRLWPATRLSALFGAGQDDAALLAALMARLGLGAAALEVEHLADRAWEREWLRDWHALRFGARLWVSPRHESVAAPGAVVVRLDPGLAFGTGTHASTALCLERLDAHPPVGQRVIDYGCGSGILAIAALKLGAREAHAFDIDTQALTATRENARENEVIDAMVVHAEDSGLPAQADLVIANILAGTLRELAPRFAALVRPGGTLLLAGILQNQTAAVTAAHAACFDMKICGQREDWVALCGVRRVDPLGTRPP